MQKTISVHENAVREVDKLRMKLAKEGKRNSYSKAILKMAKFWNKHHPEAESEEVK